MKWIGPISRGSRMQISPSSCPGQKREARLHPDVLGIHVLMTDLLKTWMAGTSPAMTPE
jgi:hypothetical protein